MRLWVASVLLAALVAPETRAQNPSFQLMAETPAGVRFAGPASVATGDFNGDGIPDLAAGDYAGSSVVVVLGLGDGTFGQSRSIPVGAAVRQIALADFDGDGNLDAVAICTGPNSVVMLKGNGDGSFESPVRLSMPSEGLAILAADLNGDGIPDLAIGQAQSILIAFGNGDLTFQSPAQIPLTTQPVAIRRGDLNGDGIPDLAIAGVDSVNFGVGSVSILLADADGGFRPVAPVKVGRPSDLAIGDFDNDQHADLAVAGRYYGYYYIVPGNGDGTFRDVRTVAMEEGPLAVAAADFNGDGVSDLVFGNYYGGKIAILLSKGDGTFERLPDIQAKGDTYSIAVADVNGDGLPDVIGANFSSRSLTVAWGRGEGFFVPALTLGSNPVWAAIGTFDMDGSPAVAVANFLGDNVVVLRSGLQLSDTYPVGLNPVRVVIGDFNGDGVADLAALNNGSGDISILLGNGDGTFQQALNTVVGKSPVSMGVIDSNGDGMSDLVVTLAAEDGLLLVGKGNGEFEPAVRIPGTANARSIAVADFNRDGIADFAIEGSTTRLFLGKDGRSFQPPVSLFAVEGFQSEVLTADINGDGKPDLVINTGLGGAVLLGKGDGSFESAKPVEGPASGTGTYNGMVAADFSGDGKPDLAVIVGTVALLYGNGDGTFRSPLPLGVDTRPFLIRAVDWNQDGKTDLVTVNSQTGIVSVLLNAREGL